ncbi:VWA domain-containing protein [Epilithonimonas hungarica]|uniref:VWFA domain-containing protein n=1 Tax=Epilithonimonas hungarica TaxID=454006 RepID=A0A1G7JGF9_9FLAO|nr:VWA domain-containing protein [Epilithonimonas hungarica]SDF24006.1 protein of unknown function DUF11 [Epilithonimonas hungarica]
MLIKKQTKDQKYLPDIKMRSWIVSLLILCIQTLSAQCGADIFILNDNSGSVDAREYSQSKQFISRLAIEMSPLGTATNQTRIAIGDFSNTNEYRQYDFPGSTNNYTTLLSDIVSYENAPRILNGGTNVGYGMSAASIVAGLPQIPGRNVAQVMIILTDAYPSQIPQSILTTAALLKSKGFSVIVMAIDDAVPDQTLPLVASPGGYFSAVDYQSLSTNVIARAKQLAAQACTYVPPTPMPDLTVSLSNFTVKNCTTTPEYSLNYVANNIGNVAFSGNLYISLYDADPHIPGTNLLGVYNAGTVNIAAGSSFSGTITGINIPNLKTAQTVFALVNYNGNTAGNQVPVSSSISQAQLSVSPEKDAQNNLSAGTNLISGTGCNMAILNTSVTSEGGACDDIVKYTVQICNSGPQPANITNVLPFAAPNFVLTGSTSPTCDIIGNTFTQLGTDIDGFAGEYFGSDGVYLSNDGLTVLSGSFTNRRVYSYNGTDWVQKGSDITGNDVSSAYLSGNGNTVAIADLSATGSPAYSPVVRIYDWNGSSWQQRGLDISENFGTSTGPVSLSDDGNTLAVVRGGASSTTSGVAVYRWNGTAWVLKGAPIIGTTNDLLSRVAMSADGNFLLTGGDIISNGKGLLKSYAWNAATSQWVQRGQTIVGTVTNQLLGFSIDISDDGNTLAAGAHTYSSIGGAVKLYTWNSATSQWVQKGATLTTGGSNDYFGFDVTLSSSGNTVVCGPSNPTIGTVRVYEYVGSAWVLRNSIPQEQPADRWGLFVAVSANGQIVAGSAYENNGAGTDAGQVRVFKFDATCAPLASGDCATYTYTYDVTNAAGGTYDFDAIVQATKTNAAHSNPIINPDKNFTAQNSATVGDGFDGSNHLDDNVTLFDNAFCSTTHTIDVAVSLNPTSVCAGDFSAATLTITNPYPVAIYNTQLNLNLNNGSLYVSEPYNVSNIVLPGNLGFTNTTGAKTFTVYSLAPGINSFKLDIGAAVGTTALKAQLTNINPAYNNNSATTPVVTSNVVGVAAPVLTGGTCPATVTSTATTINLSYSFSGAASYKWSSGTNGVFANSTNPVTTYTINPQDYANGYVDFVLTAYSSIGCETVIPCRVNISGVQRDYGDAPVSYDLNERAIPVAAAHSLFTGLYLGALPPDAEVQNQPSAAANLDGAEEDGLSSVILTILSTSSTYSLPIKVTNTSSKVAYANAFIDWNADGDFLDDNETGITVTVPANSGTKSYNIDFATPSGITLPANSYVRLRTSLDSDAVKRPFAAAGGGEVEDFYVTVTTAFGCSNNMYLSQSDGSSTTLYTINTAVNPFTYPTIGDAAIAYNAIGLNPLDGKMYGMQQSSSNLRVINTDGSTTNLGVVSGLPSANYFGGEIDNSGNYYVIDNNVNGTNTMYKININTRTATSISLKYANNTAAALYLPDMSYSITTGLLYGVNGFNNIDSGANRKRQLISINPSTGLVKPIGAIYAESNYGAMYTSSTGEVFGIRNDGGFYQFNLTTGERVLISGAAQSSGNDGAHCVTSPITFTADLKIEKTDNTLTYVPGSSTTYTVVVSNLGPSYGVVDALVKDAVPAGIPAANVSYTAVASPGSTTSVSGTQTGAINDLVGLPVNGSVTYTITVNIPIDFTGDLVNIASVTAPANITDSNQANNIATDTDSSSACFKPATTIGTVLETQHGITSLNRAGNTASGGNWPMVRKGAWTVLESKTKGFVVNRLTSAQIASIPAADIIEGMAVYNTDLKCLQVNTTGTAAGWSCLSTPACPSN